jgi:Flp pilus assembly protein TadD
MASWALGAARQATRAQLWEQVADLTTTAEKWGADAGLTGQIMVAATRKAGRPDQAVAHARVWVNQRPWDSDGWNSLGAAQGESGDWEGALNSLKRAWELSPANGAAALNVAVIYHSMGQWKESVDWFEKVWSTHPELFQKETGRYEEARNRLLMP